MYCDYCGYSWISTPCRICGLLVRSCGCDVADVCEEHFCVECSDPFLELSEEGMCMSCYAEYSEFMIQNGRKEI